MHRFAEVSDETAPALHDQHDGTDKPLLIQGLLDNGMDAGWQIPRRNAPAHGKHGTRHGKHLNQIGEAVTIKILRLKKKQARVPFCADLSVRN
ncbi:hypothetical protein [Azospirillum sp. SYSU D00513]|uniref:hypothetical protein n=1 Tax=Azospirillum sp. SYSU D00513 TaxID=2812561 RepID=UPI001A96F38E|nr:hypothetical protein [Azospirillum sp. SYSU D00513]